MFEIMPVLYHVIWIFIIIIIIIPCISALLTVGVIVAAVIMSQYCFSELPTRMKVTETRD